MRNNRSSRPVRRLIETVVACLPVIVFSAHVQAHAILVKAIPAQDAKIGTAPVKVELWFNENVGSQYAALAVIDGNGIRADGRDSQLGVLDRSHLSVSLPKVPPGTYTVRYRVLSADGHVVSGKYGFSVLAQ